MEDTVSMKELREEFPRIKKELLEGKTFVLIYNSVPLAEITPIKKEPKKKGDVFKWLANLPKGARFRSPKSSVEIIRELRQ